MTPTKHQPKHPGISIGNPSKVKIWISPWPWRRKWSQWLHGSGAWVFGVQKMFDKCHPHLRTNDVLKNQTYHIRHVLRCLSLWICFICNMFHLSEYAHIRWLKGHQIECIHLHLRLEFAQERAHQTLKLYRTPVRSMIQIPAPNNCILQWTSSVFLFQQASLVKLSKNPDGT